MFIKIGRRTFVTRLASAAAGLAGAFGMAHAAASTPKALALVEVAEGIYVYEGAQDLMNSVNAGAISNLGAIVGADAIAVIDSGGSIAEAHALIAAIAAISTKPIRYLINTHMHPDHVFGNAAFRDIGATIVGHRNLPRALDARRDFYLRNVREQMGDEPMRGVEIVSPTLLVDDMMTLDLGGRTLDVKAWKPAHTDNDVTVFDTATRTLFTGDMVFVGHLPTVDGSLLGWMRQLDQLAALDAARAVPGHGPATVPWPQALDAERRYFDILARDLRKSIADGVPLSEAVTTAAASERPNWTLFDVHNERNATAAFAELEWE